MVLVVALLAYFCLIGLIARRFGTGVRLLLLAGIAAMVVIDFVVRAIP